MYHRGSLSARRAWIEIQNGGGVRSVRGVALRKESVDRNNPGWRKDWQQYVALRKESVDRNSPPLRLLTPAMSLSARRAWIEISDM